MVALSTVGELIVVRQTKASVGRGPRPGVRLLSAMVIVAGILIMPTGPAWAAAPFGNALKLDGVDDYASIADNSSLDLGNTDTADFTIESFIYVPNTTNNTTDVVLWKQYAYALSILFHSASQDTLSFKFWACGSLACEATLTTSTDLATGWHHLAAVFDNEWSEANDRAAIYLDGSEAVAASNFEFTPGVNNSANPLSLGANSGGVAFEGWLEEARLSDIVRYSGSYSVPTSAFSTDGNTRALWHFDEAACSTSFADASPNANTLSGLNGAQTGPPGALTPTLQLSAASYSRVEGRRANVIVTRTGDPLLKVAAKFTTSDGTATAGVDYQAVSRGLTFNCGVMSKSVKVTTIEDALVEGNETVNLALSRPRGGATLGSPSTGTLTIVDND
jgi:Calx-beta domain-containing protein/concanavalin A-like lectin/glucanase superfamily protein